MRGASAGWPSVEIAFDGVVGPEGPLPGHPAPNARGLSDQPGVSALRLSGSGPALSLGSGLPNQSIAGGLFVFRVPVHGGPAGVPWH